MSQVSVEISAEMERWVQSRVTRGRYLDVGDYVRALIRQDLSLEDADTEWLRSRYAESLASGTIDAEPEDVIEQIIAELPGEND